MSGTFCSKCCGIRSTALGLSVPLGPREAEARAKRKTLGFSRHWRSQPRRRGGRLSWKSDHFKTLPTGCAESFS